MHSVLAQFLKCALPGARERRLHHCWLPIKVSWETRLASWEMAHQHKQSQSTLAQSHPENNNARAGKVFTGAVLGSTGCMILTYPPTCFRHYNTVAFIRAQGCFSSSSSAFSEASPEVGRTPARANAVMCWQLSGGIK